MAKSAAAWGIDIGQCALKAVRCRLDDKNPGKIVADAFDYIEYPKILSQPEADPVELVREALEQFLTRNELRKAKVAVSVSGQSGLARFIKLPPVETKKIPDIVRYEANQQIPFDLDEVIWDYQRMFGGSEEEGFALETEVGFFAMKRDQVFQEIEPYLEAGIDLDFVQLTPLALYNFAVYDQLGKLPHESEFDPDDPPESLVLLSVGTETTDLVITNGFRVWQRSVPLGGSHFTKALVKELQLTYAKAEHLKRNATHAQDPKALFQAMRPVFKDLLTEIQRSIGYFHSIDKSAKIGRVVALGNSIKLPGLKRYLSQNLDTEVEEIASFTMLTGSSVTQSPAFRENLLAFGVPYGLAVQALGVSRLSTNLVPKEIVFDRIINRKKPWAVAASMLLALGCLISFLLLWFPWYKIRIDADPNWKDVTTQANAAQSRVNQFEQNYQAADAKYKTIVQTGDNLIAHFDRRMNWLNLFEAVYAALPKGQLGSEPSVAPPEEFEDVSQGPKSRTQIWNERETIWITDMRSQRYDDLATWYASNNIATKYQENTFPVNVPLPAKQRAALDVAIDEAPQPTEVPLATRPFENGTADSTAVSGPGWVIQLTGFHFHDSNFHGKGASFVRRTLIHNLQDELINVPDIEGNDKPVTAKDLGIRLPVVYEMKEPKRVKIPDDPGDGGETPDVELTQYRFVVQFAWTPDQFTKQQKAQVAQLTPAN